MIRYLRVLALLYITVILAACTITNPSVTKVTNSYFVVTHPLKYSAGKDKPTIVVPVGFLTDLASIPKKLWWWQSPMEAAMAPGIIHDYLYWEQSCTKPEADIVLYLALKDTGMGEFDRWLVYEGVNKVGKKFYDGNTAARKGGETRFLTEAFTIKLQESPVDPSATLATIYKEAIASDGLSYPPTPNSSVKEACLAAMVEYEAKK